MASVKDIRAKLLAKASKRPVKGGAGDPVETFKNTANTQIENVKKAIKKRENGEDFRADFNSRSDWYVGVRGGYGVSFGRFRPKIDGEDYFVVDDLEEVIETIEMAIELADDDTDFQNQIIAASDAIRAQLAKGKGSTKRK